MICYDSLNPVRLVADVSPWARNWRNQKDIWRWCRQYTLISESEQRAWCDRIAGDKTIKMYGIAIPCNNVKSDDFDQAFLNIGTCGFTSIDKHNQNAEFSLLINPKHRGHGYGLKALKTLIQHGFFDHNFKRIWGESYDDNPAHNLFKKCGMQKEGILRSSYYRNGKFINSHIFAVLRDEWDEYK